jgi:hypothetical protein
MNARGQLWEVLGILDTPEQAAARARYHGLRAVAAICVCTWLSRVWREAEART